MPMTVPEYKAAFDEIRDRQRKELDELNRKFATENSTVKIGISTFVMMHGRRTPAIGMVFGFFPYPQAIIFRVVFHGSYSLSRSLMVYLWLPK